MIEAEAHSAHSIVSCGATATPHGQPSILVDSQRSGTTGQYPAVFVVIAGVMLAVSVSIVAMPAAARETLTAFLDRVRDQASSAGAPTAFLRLLARPERLVSGLRVVGVLYAVAAGALLLYALT